MGHAEGPTAQDAASHDPGTAAHDRDDAGLVEVVRSSVIGEQEAVTTPFGLRRVVYADYTASGRALSFIEDHLRDVVLPLYANTHTETSGTGRQTSRFREEARELIAEAFGAGEDHVVLFTGSGSTGAIDKLIRVLGLRLPDQLDARYELTARIPADERPVVFIGPFEHHSNELPWRETIADVVTIPEDADGHIDLGALEAALVRFADRPLKIGSFSAASNVTGILTDTRAVSVLLHRHGALSLWDAAAAAPYVDVAMAPHRAAPDGGTAEAALDHKDAVFVSPHKLVGGPGTPGLLIARRELFTNRVPTVPGGGTVRYVNEGEHRFLDDVEHREEGGTPDIIGSIRCGLVFKLKTEVGVDRIQRLEERAIERAVSAWRDEPNLQILGNLDAARLSIVSFVIRHERGYVHHDLVVALLNDLYGIQARGGCSCAGPYGHRLLGIDVDRSHAFEEAIVGGCEGLKPGWVRVNFTWFQADAVIDFVIAAVRDVARHGHRMLDHYRFDVASGRWTHRDGLPEAPMSLRDVRFSPQGVDWPHRRRRVADQALPDVLGQAHAIMTAPVGRDAPSPPVLAPQVEELRWFPLPGERSASPAG
ncbi:MAG: aminotransferase class V-fold PLP-dependent enzyme [Nitriliruptoraceae bacterium]|nr:aminotransferase class V-fold PLP-dependent enzyme [Nitriliruptoraceae bacterium]